MKRLGFVKVLMLLTLAWGALGQEPTERLLADLRRLTDAPHRLTGSDASRSAGDYLLERLGEIGVPRVMTLQFPVVPTDALDRQAVLTVDGREVLLEAVRANVIAGPAVASPLEAPLVYLGSGDGQGEKGRPLEGAVVVLDYDSAGAWRRAFARGASAVVFVGTGESADPVPKHAPVPLNLPRFYVPRGRAEAAGLLTDQGRVRLEQRTAGAVDEADPAAAVGRNVIAYFPGSDPAGEVAVVAAAYDSFGVVPGRSPAARRAANVAGLLELAQQWVDQPPRRGVLMVFFDARAQRHRGARFFYDALTVDTKDHEQQIEQHDREQVIVEQALADLALATDRASGGNELSDWLRERLRAQADWTRADLDRARQNLRRAETAQADEEARAARLGRLGEQVAGWDRIRRWLHRGGQWASAPGSEGDRVLIDQLIAQTRAALARRAAELGRAGEQLAQRTALREAVGVERENHRVVFHATLDLSDGVRAWAPVAGDWTDRALGLRRPDSTADAPGFHARMLGQLDDLADYAPGEPLTQLDREALRDPVYARSLVPGPHVDGGAVAGSHGIYHFSVMTAHDARPRDGHPSDTLGRFDLPVFAGQLREAAVLLRRAVDAPSMTLRESFASQVVTKRSGWEGDRATGSVASRRVTGGLSESRPAAGAAVALWPGDRFNPDVSWVALSGPAPADYSTLDIVPVDSNGRFEIVGLRRDLDQDLTMLGFERNRRGEVTSITTRSTLVQEIASSLRTDLIAARGFGLTWRGTELGEGRPYQLMRASSDTAYRPNLSLVSRGEDHLFWYLADRAVEPRVKVFDPLGAVVLGVAEEGGGVEGVALDGFTAPRGWAAQAATDLWRLNEGRLSRLRVRGVTSPDIEVLHAEAGRLAERPEAAALARSVALSQKVYPRLQQTMEDLVHAIVMLLLLSIPFAFALERLVIGATGVYGRLGGFTAIFLLTFGVLYATHPGFAVSSTPVMIFLAFAITLLSVMVIWLLVRRFQTELKVMQGVADGGGAQGQASGGGGVMAAIGMGMSTMRRRPTRTTLTTITVVMLTFTILCFASVSRQVGVRTVALGPVTDEMPPRAVLVRSAAYGALPIGTTEVLASPQGGRGQWFESWWKTSGVSGGRNRPVTVARADDGRSARLGGVMGVDAAAVQAWPKLAAAGGQALAGGGDAPTWGDDSILLPADTAARLELAVGDTVRVEGRPLRYAGPTDAGALTRLRQADGESWLPVDEAAQAQRQSGGGDTSAIDAGDTLISTIRLSANQVAVAPNRAVEAMGGELRSVTYLAGPEEDTAALARELTAVLPTPVWSTGSTGIRRTTFGPVTRVSGLLPLLAPVVLGGLIIFGTLLGSISDRQREIYTFSALGLGPRHVGLLFFAEAGVYAAVGGLGGQLLAQVVALGASWMASWGWIEPVSINFASTQALFAIAVVMATVLISAIYPAVRASRSANPGLARAWVMPGPEPAPHDDQIQMIFPFTVSAYDLTGVVAFLADYFGQHADAGLGAFAASDVGIDRDARGRVRLSAELALAPFDLGVTQRLTLTGVPSDIDGVDEVEVHLLRHSGTKGDWVRANRVFIKRLRRQFLLWRTLPTSATERYRMQTLGILGEQQAQDAKPDAAAWGGAVAPA